MGRLPRNWLLLFGNLDEEEKDTLVELAEFGPAFLGNISRIGCFAEGHGYVDGEEAWSVDYDYESRKPADALRVDGPLPPELAAIIEQARAAEAKGQGATSESICFSKYRARCPRRYAASVRTRSRLRDFAGRCFSGSVASRRPNQDRRDFSPGCSVGAEPKLATIRSP